ncbi:helix-turn-helix transcriptional regulator [Arthrobacter sp. SIMBA_036]|uniref:helix-turn-helix domain-containing protein n=1 Tax=Arthrobacter sp. SIMBA_036 TaxID=3085778 RepID=UPI003978C5FC
MKISADELRLVRSHMDLTQAEMASHLGISPRTIVNWETSGVPDSKAARVLSVLQHDLEEAKQEEWYRESVANMPVPEVPPGYMSADAEVEDSRPGLHPDRRRANLLQAFTDSDLLAELRSRALRRGDRESTWDAARFERYQQFVAPKWEDPKPPNSSEADAFDSAARKGEEDAS